MSTTYPTTKQTFSDPAGTSLQTSPDHAALHTDKNDTIEAIEDVLGTTGGTSVLKSFAAGEFPVRATGVAATGTLQQTIVGGTISPVLGTVGTLVSSTGTVGTLNVGTYSTVNSIPGSALSTSAITLGSAVITTGFVNAGSAAEDVTGLSVAVTVPSGGRNVKVSFYGVIYNKQTIAATNQVAIKEGTTTLQTMKFTGITANYTYSLSGFTVLTPSAGAHTYKATTSTTTGTVGLEASATEPNILLVELI